MRDKAILVTSYGVNYYVVPASIKARARVLKSMSYRSSVFTVCFTLLSFRIDSKNSYFVVVNNSVEFEADKGTKSLLL